MSNRASLATRLLGVGLATAICVITVGLVISGRIGMYINPDSAWFALLMSVVGVVAAVGTFLVPLGAEADHGHDHGTAHVHEHPADAPPTSRRAAREARPVADVHRPAVMPLIAASVGGVLASAVVVLMLVLPPASLSAQAAADRDIGSPPLFGGEDTIVLAASGDVSAFGVGEWAAVFATTGDPASFDGTEVTLTGFLTAGETPSLGRLVVTHCVIDAQPASVALTKDDAVAVPAGTWLEVVGTVRAADDGTLAIEPSAVTEIDEPADPYEY